MRLVLYNLIRTWNPQAVGTSRCLDLPFKSGPPQDPQGCLVCLSKWPHPGGMLSQYALTTVSKRVILKVLWKCNCYLLSAHNGSLNFRAGRDFKGDLVQPLHFINKEIKIQREGPCPRSDTGYVTEPAQDLSFHCSCFIPHQTWSLLDRNVSFNYTKFL